MSRYKADPDWKFIPSKGTCMNPKKLLDDFCFECEYHPDCTCERKCAGYGVGKKVYQSTKRARRKGSG